MKKLALFVTLLAAVALPVLHASPARAQNFRSWVASYGGGSACTRAAPCRDFPSAIAATAPSGEVNCLDQGDYTSGDSIIIDKSITIDCEDVQARLSGLQHTAFTINAGSTDVIVLRGLDINGAVYIEAGIDFLNGAALHVEKCVINDFSGQFGYGIALQPVFASSTMELYVSDTVTMNNAAVGTGAGILVQPQASNTVNKVILNRVEARNNYFGIKADGTYPNVSGGVINMTVRDSVASGNSANGIVGTSNSVGPAIVMMVDLSTSSHNGAGYGIIADGPRTRIDMTRSTVSGNNFGIGASNGGRLISYQDNRIDLNSTDGSPTGVISFK